MVFPNEFLFSSIVLLHIVCHGRTSSCINKEEHVSLGRSAVVKPAKRWYNLDEIVKFSCPKTFHLVDRYGKSKSSYIWLKCTFNGWNHPWPYCRGPYENVTCYNEYLFTEKFEKSWLNETPNRKHAISSQLDVRFIKYFTTLKFTCPPGMNFLGAKGLPVMQSTCMQNGEWSAEWPMCKGQACSPYRLINGYSGTEDRLFTPGTSVNLSCYRGSGFHLYGTNTSKCLPNLSWSASDSRECLTMARFRSRCKKEGGDYSRSGNYEPICRRQYKNFDEMRAQEDQHKMRIIIATSVSLSMLFVVFLVVSSMYVYRLRRRNFMLAIAVREQNEDHALQMFLPSYEEAQKDKPTTPPPTFDESTMSIQQQAGLILFPGGRAESTNANGSTTATHLPSNSPPPYTTEENEELL